ncbi:hypothetical protein PoB_002981900 [Plakobranchus ocellatus]|uniref:Uncharacterized protein n=1 Tax=Plakobranchus ocellatus TaxID=259542 RepID=A0AAV4AAN8_9GAST|nr:hypothetical protein PoB_002981900 [Plakobranchus ocellatus]
MDFVIQGGREVSALTQSRDGDRTLKKKLSSLEQEKARSMRELEINRQKFLRSHISLVPKTMIIRRGLAPVNLFRKIEDAKEDQRLCQASLNQRKDDFIDALKKNPFSNNIVSQNKRVARLEALRKDEERNAAKGSLPSYTMRSHDMELFQKSFQLANQHQIKRQRPFMKSVNIILQKLKGEKRQEVSQEKQSQQEKFDFLTRHILSTYAGINADVDADGEKNEENEKCATNEQESHDTRLRDYSIKSSAPADETSRKDHSAPSGKGMQTKPSLGQEKTNSKKQSLKERVSGQAETKHAQVEIEETNMHQNQADISIQVIPPGKRIPRAQPTYIAHQSNEILPNINKGRSTITGDCVSSNRSVKTHNSLVYPKSPRSPRSPRLLSVDNFSQDDVQPPRSRVNSWSSGQQSRKESLNDEFRRRSSFGGHPGSTGEKKVLLTTTPVESSNPKINLSNAVVLVHEDTTYESQPRRKSIFSLEKHDNKEVSYKDDSHVQRKKEITKSFSGVADHDKGELAGELSGSAPEEKSTETSSVDKEENLRPEELNLDFEEESARSESTIVSLVNNRSRAGYVGSREGSARSRRMSVQTDGALRLWASVQRQEADAEEGPDSTAYRMAMENVVNAAADVEEQSQRLEHVRRSSLSLYPLDLYRRPSLETKEDKSVEKLRMRRGSVTEPSKPTADVRDEVYKFLQRKFSTTELRRMSLTSAEGHMHSGTTLDDITGRRSSISLAQSTKSQSSSRRGSAGVQTRSLAAKAVKFNDQSSVHEVKKLTAAMDSVRGTSRRNSTAVSPSSTSPASPSLDSISTTTRDVNTLADIATRRSGRSYSWAPDVSSTQDWHILALELLARNRNGTAKFRTIRDLLQGLADEYRKQTTAMMYEELRYCTYLRVPARLLPPDLKNSDYRRKVKPDADNVEHDNHAANGAGAAAAADDENDGDCDDNDAAAAFAAAADDDDSGGSVQSCNSRQLQNNRDSIYIHSLITCPTPLNIKQDDHRCPACNLCKWSGGCIVSSCGVISLCLCK